MPDPTCQKVPTQIIPATEQSLDQTVWLSRRGFFGAAAAAVAVAAAPPKTYEFFFAPAQLARDPERMMQLQIRALAAMALWAGTPLAKESCG